MPSRRVVIACCLAAMFCMAAPLHAGDPPPSLVSVAPNGAVGNGPSDSPSVNATGTCVAFQSAASDLVAGDTNGWVDVFVRDLVNATTARLSVATDGTQANGHSFEPAVSGDCRVVAFTSRASNLVADDTNGVADVFVHDLSTHVTRRVSLRPDGTQGNQEASSPGISGDGHVVAFDTAGNPTSGTGRVFVHDRATGQTTEIALPAARMLRQPAISADGRYVAFMSYARTGMPGDYYDEGVWLHDRTTGATQRIASAPGPDDPLIGRPAIDAAGTTVAFGVTSVEGPARARDWHVTLFDRVTGETRPLTYQQMPGWPSRSDFTCTVAPCGATMRPSLDASGRQVGLSQYGNTSAFVFDLWVVDRWAASGVRVGSLIDGTTPLIANTREVSLSGDGRLAAFAGSALVDDSAAPAQVWVSNVDQDRDGMPGYWERSMGLADGHAPTDATLDSDGDGVGNLDEYRAGSHPLGFFRNYLAEGATSEFFSTTLAITGSGPVMLTFQRANATIVREFRSAVSSAPTAVDVVGLAGMEHAEFSTLVESASPLVVDRTMTWDRTRYSGHAETAQSRPRLTWYFAEGATHSGMDLFYLLQNPSTESAVVDVTYLLPSPSAPLVKRYAVAPSSRYTIWVNKEHALLAATDVSATIRSTNAVPILAERALYANQPGRMFNAGHAAAGIGDLSSDWYFAEGATGAMFDEFITIANPGDTVADVDVTYLLPGGDTVAVAHRVAPSSRYTIWVDYDHPRLSDTAVSAVVRARDGIGIAAERVLWWPGPTAATWDEAHVVVGATRPWRRWAIADGITDADTDMFVLIGNPSPAAATARVTLTWLGGTETRDYALAPTSRANAWINAEFSPPPGRFSVLVESDADVVVERATYWDANGRAWAGGSAAMAVPQPLVFASEPDFVAATAPTHRSSFNDVPTGAVSFPFALDGLTFELTAAEALATVEPAGASGLATNYLAATLNVGVDNVLITLPPGIRAAGLWLTDAMSAWNPQVTMMDAAGAGASTTGRFVGRPSFVGFESANDIVTIRLWSNASASPPGFPVTTHLNLGDILTRR